jgi:hypothetical protein
MLKTPYYILLFLLLPFSLCGQQNLVPNPSFEIYDTCPYYGSQIYFASPWFQPNIYWGNTTNSSSSDYFNTCSDSTFGVPYNFLGYQSARTGNGYAGIDFYASNETREYLEIQLSSPLIANRIYCVEFFVSLSDYYNIGTDNIHLSFSPTIILDSSPYSAIPLSPDIHNSIGNIITDTTNWTQISGTYTAVGGERYIVIGNFYNNSNTDTIGSGDDGYYYIDDISVIECDSISSGIPDSNNIINVFPNPMEDFVTIKSDTIYGSYEVRIYDILGHIIYSGEKNPGIDLQIDTSKFPSGNYILQLTSSTTNTNYKLVKL